MNAAPTHAESERHAAPPHAPATRVPLALRVGPAVMRRARLLLARLQHPRATFGPACDVRRRFVLRQSPGAIVNFGPRCILDNDLTIECYGRLSVGANTIFGHHCTLAARQLIEIGPDCMLAELVSVRDHDHVFDDPHRAYADQGMRVAPVRIGRNVWIGAKATIVAGVTIGDGAVVGANAVVTRDVAARTVVAGVPARVIRRLPAEASRA